MKKNKNKENISQVEKSTERLNKLIESLYIIKAVIKSFNKQIEELKSSKKDQENKEVLKSIDEKIESLNSILEMYINTKLGLEADLPSAESRYAELCNYGGALIDSKTIEVIKRVSSSFKIIIGKVSSENQSEVKFIGEDDKSISFNNLDSLYVWEPILNYLDGLIDDVTKYDETNNDEYNVESLVNEIIKKYDETPDKSKPKGDPVEIEIESVRKDLNYLTEKLIKADIMSWQYKQVILNSINIFENESDNEFLTYATKIALKNLDAKGDICEKLKMIFKKVKSYAGILYSELVLFKNKDNPPFLDELTKLYTTCDNYSKMIEEIQLNTQLIEDLLERIGKYS